MSVSIRPFNPLTLSLNIFFHSLFILIVILYSLQASKAIIIIDYLSSLSLLKKYQDVMIIFQKLFLQ